MNSANKLFLTAPEIAEMLDVSVPYSYKIIKNMNNELAKQGYITIAGKVSRGYFEKKWYGYEA